MLFFFSLLTGIVYLRCCCHCDCRWFCSVCLFLFKSFGYVCKLIQRYDHICYITELKLALLSVVHSTSISDMDSKICFQASQLQSQLLIVGIVDVAFATAVVVNLFVCFSVANFDMLPFICS